MVDTPEKTSLSLTEQLEQLLESGLSKHALRSVRRSLSKAEQRQTAMEGVVQIACELSRVAGMLDLGELLEFALSQALSLVQAERGLLVLRDDSDQFEVTISKHLGKDESDINFSNSLLSHVMDTGEALVTTNAQDDPRFASQHSVFIHSIRSVLAIPLLTPTGVIGAFYLDTQIGTKVFDQEDLPIVTALAGITASAVQLARVLDVRQTLFLESVRALVSAVEAKDAYTAGHSSRVGMYAQAIMRVLGKSETEAEQALIAGFLHDIGKIGISDAHVVKKGPLTDKEWLVFKQHTLIGERILEHSSALKPVLPAVRWHHEKLDGSGYPDGLQGDAIPLLARVLCVADSFDAMTSDRPYRESPGKAYALSELKRLSGKHYDPVIVGALSRALENGTIPYIGKG